MGVLPCDDTLINQLSSGFWHALSDLLSQNCVLISTLLNCDPVSFKSRRVDILDNNWDKIASRIANDLASGHVRKLHAPVVFPA